MAIARCQQIDISVARWYHCMSRCVRQALLLTEGAFNRKEWLEDRVQELESQIDRLSHQAASHPLHFFPRDIGAFCRSFAF